MQSGTWRTRRSHYPRTVHWTNLKKIYLALKSLDFFPSPCVGFSLRQQRKYASVKEQLNTYSILFNLIWKLSHRTAKSNVLPNTWAPMFLWRSHTLSHHRGNVLCSVKPTKNVMSIQRREKGLTAKPTHMFTACLLGGCPRVWSESSSSHVEWQDSCE